MQNVMKAIGLKYNNLCKKNELFRKPLELHDFIKQAHIEIQ